MNRLTVGLVQYACSTNRQKNIEAAETGICKAVDQGAQLVILPELHNSHYFCQTEDTDCFDLAETIPGPSTDYFSTLARELGVVLILSLFEKRAAGLYHNTAVVIEKDGQIAGKYRKMHIPDDPGYHEKFYFTPGDLGFTPIDTSVGRLGLLVHVTAGFGDNAGMLFSCSGEVGLVAANAGFKLGDLARNGIMAGNQFGQPPVGVICTRLRFSEFFCFCL